MQKNLYKLSQQLQIASIPLAESKLLKIRKLTDQVKQIHNEFLQLSTEMKEVVELQDSRLTINKNIKHSIYYFKHILRDCPDVVFRPLTIGKTDLSLLYLDNLCDAILLEQGIIRPVLSSNEDMSDTLQSLEKQITATSYTKVDGYAQALEQLFSGNVVMLIDGAAQALAVKCAQYIKRGVEEAKSEQIVRGAHDGFNETLSDNIVLLRRRTKDPNLKFKLFKIGTRTKNDVAMLYIDNLAKKSLVAQIESKLKTIYIDKIVVSHTIQEYLSNNTWSIFPQVQGTERPDVTIAALYEGRVAIMVDNTPWTLIIPCTYISLMQSVDDFTMHTIAASLTRLLRHFAVLLAIYLPALYVALISYNPSMLPPSLTFYLAALRGEAPFPAPLETFLMIGILEMFQEAIARLPQKLVMMASVVGGLVIGTTVAQAGLVNPLLVVITAATAISTYSMNYYYFGISLRITRFVILIFATVLGLYGVVLGAMILITYLCSLNSFGEYFMGGFFEIDLLKEWKTSIVRAPTKCQFTRPRMYGPQDIKKTREQDE